MAVKSKGSGTNRMSNVPGNRSGSGQAPSVPSVPISRTANAGRLRPGSPPAKSTPKMKSP